MIQNKQSGANRDFWASLSKVEKDARLRSKGPFGHLLCYHHFLDDSAAVPCPFHQILHRRCRSTSLHHPRRWYFPQSPHPRPSHPDSSFVNLNLLSLSSFLRNHLILDVVVVEGNRHCHYDREIGICRLRERNREALLCNVQVGGDRELTAREPALRLCLCNVQEDGYRELAVRGPTVHLGNILDARVGDAYSLSNDHQSNHPESQDGRVRRLHLQKQTANLNQAFQSVKLENKHRQ